MHPSRSRTVLLIAYHYPPCAMSSGVQRTLSFSRHLAQYGWRPVVLTADPASYNRTSVGQLKDIPDYVPVTRTRALDAARHFAIRGRYWSRLALPDRWCSWWLTAVPAGLRLILRHDIAAIWSTYPIATTHLIGATLARLTGRPWIADFRDPMVETIAATGEVFPHDPLLRRARLKVENRVVQRASRLVFCTDAARRIVQNRFPMLPAERLEVISNGYDEQAFRDAEAVTRPASNERRILLHSGTIYPGSDRDPSALMRALRSLLDSGVVTPQNFELRLRDPSNEEYFQQLAIKSGVGSIVSILPALPYREALAEMLGADALLLLQGYTSNPAIPAKLYEYLRAGRPILALVHPHGETAATLRAVGVDTMTPLTEFLAIAQLLMKWLSAPSHVEMALPPREVVTAFSRESLTAKLACLLDQVTMTGRSAAERAADEA